jgi:predicted amidophosphoribosyltransferase
MTSGSTFPQRLTKIDDLIRPDHYYLTPDDDCYFLGEYTARKGYAFSATNQLVLNFKKSLKTRGAPQWRHKDRAIEEAASAFRASINAKWLNTATLVPVPPSKAKADPLYDNRLVRMLQAIRRQPSLDVRELIVQRANMEAAHDQLTRPKPDEIEANYEIDANLCNPAPQIIGLFDDVLTTGAHFRAAANVLRGAFPDVRIIGVFIARRVPEASDVEEFGL